MQFFQAVNGKSNSLKVHGPLWEELTCSYGMLDEKRAVMEMAAASGLPLVPDKKRDPRYTTSYGTGEMILDALNKGFRDISIAIGGSQQTMVESAASAHWVYISLMKTGKS